MEASGSSGWNQYHKTCDIPYAKREQAHDYGHDCTGAGHCWEANTPYGTPWCYKKAAGASASEIALCKAAGCEYQKVWNDEGSGGQFDPSCFAPRTDKCEMPLDDRRAAPIDLGWGSWNQKREKCLSGGGCWQPNQRG